MPNTDCPRRVLPGFECYAEFQHGRYANGLKIMVETLDFVPIPEMVTALEQYGFETQGDYAVTIPSRQRVIYRGLSKQFADLLCDVVTSCGCSFAVAEHPYNYFGRTGLKLCFNLHKQYKHDRQLAVMLRPTAACDGWLCVSPEEIAVVCEGGADE